MKKILLSILMLGVLLASFGAVSAYSPASTNDLNRDNNWAHVNEIGVDVGEVTLEFVQPRSFYSCFEYRTDGDTGQVIDEEHFLEYYGVPGSEGLQQYPYFCLSTPSTQVETFLANEYVEIRLFAGAEGDERFDWTRFDVLPAPLSEPEITGFINPSLPCGAIANIHSTTVDWTDSVGGVGGVVGYQYTINYPLADGSGQGNWSTFVTSSQYTGSLNEGVHTIKVRAKDAEGNFSEWSNECQITADWTAPDVEIINPAEGIVSGSVDIRGSVIDSNPHHYWLAIYDSSNINIVGPGTVNENESFTDKSLMLWETTSVPDGEYIIKLEARDAAGNKDSGSIDWVEVTVKNIPDPVGPPTDKSQCMKDGWKLFDNPVFRNQGDCISYIQSNQNAKGNRKDN